MHEADGLRAALQAAERRIEALTQIAQTILEGADRKDVLGLIARRARELVSGEIASIATITHDGRSLLVEAADGARSDELLGTSLPLQGSISGWAFTTGVPVNLPNGWHDERAYEPFADFAHRGPALWVVFGIGERRCGVIFATNHAGGRSFSDQDVAVIKAFGAQAAMYLGLATVRQGLQELGALGALQRRSLRETAAALARAVVEGTWSAAAMVYQRGADGSARTIGSYGVPAELVRAIDEVGRSEVLSAEQRAGHWRPAVEAMCSRRIVIANMKDAARRLRSRLHDADLTPFADSIKRVNELAVAMPCATIVAVPLIYQERVLGAITAIYPTEVGETEVTFLKVVAPQAASTIENARLVTLAQENAALKERQRLARELHDSVSQALYGIVLGTQAAINRLSGGPSTLREPLQYVHEVAEAAVSDMRSLILAMRPESLEAEGLVGALTRLALAAKARHKIDVVRRLGTEPDVSLKERQELLRIAQEAISNAAKHARANRIEISLESRSAGVTLTVSDDGVGFDADGEFPGHFGLHSIRERSRELGGVLELLTAPGRGTQVRVTIPRLPRTGERMAQTAGG